jgi:NADH dehydrogenase
MAKRILVVGAGFAGMWSALSAARVLEASAKADGSVEIMVVAPDPALHIRPRLYERPTDDMRAPLARVFDAARVRFVQGRVDQIRSDEKIVEVLDEHGSRSEFTYDKLVLASGSQLHRAPVPGLVEFAHSVDQYHEIVALEKHLAGLAALPSTNARNTVVVVGGGFTGIETAAEMPARMRAHLGSDAPIRTIIVEQASALGPDLGPNPRPVIEEALTAQSVDWQLGLSVRSVDADGLYTSDGSRIESKTVIWTAGLRASPLTSQIPAERDPLGRLLVDRELRVEGVSDIFATGDVAFAATDDLGNHALMSCQHAMNLGRVAGHNVASDLLGQKTTVAYSQPKYVTCLSLGPWGAVYTEGWERAVKMQGLEAKQLKHQINTEWIYPPAGGRAEVLQAADPLRIVVA